ncbi:hypothetical protein [Rhizobium laguerreae]|uniref:hypothetical protein n=1 Tax=Rhizobium laguerreae TaxID=1076926 RepID=UPI001C90B97D|nr:hypothetical protein [Rhizobium laguerreae]MBY3483330.1 hypothetical protein [Rhizobium laguerreae]
MSVKSLATIFFLIAATAKADQINPIGLADLCPDGTPREIWFSPLEARIPDNATRIDCGAGQTCFIFHTNACFFITEQSAVIHADPDRIPEPHYVPTNEVLIPFVSETLPKSSAQAPIAAIEIRRQAENVAIAHR